MAITVSTAFAGAEIDADGNMIVKLSKQVWNGEKLLAAEPHRQGIEAGADIADRLAKVDAMLVAEGFAAMPAKAKEAVAAVRGVIVDTFIKSAQTKR